MGLIKDWRPESEGIKPSQASEGMEVFPQEGNPI